MMGKSPEGTDISCGIFVMAMAAVAGISLPIGLLLLGVPVQEIERGMVWLSIPWFAFWYLKCRK
jgi:hypothetical protein